VAVGVVDLDILRLLVQTAVIPAELEVVDLVVKLTLLFQAKLVLQIPEAVGVVDHIMVITAAAVALVLLWLDIEFKNDKKCRTFPAFFYGQS
jgi:hypothetical protein